MMLGVRHAGDTPQGHRPFGNRQQRDDIIDAMLIEVGTVNLVNWSYSAHAALAVAARRPDLPPSNLLYEPGFANFVEHAT
jgi:hypothetical protein